MKEYIRCPEVTLILNNCLKIVNWFSSHKRALLMLLEEQQAINEKRPPGQKWERLKRFVRAAITRWGTHALSVRRLVELQGALLDLVNHRPEDLESAGGDDNDSRAITAEIIKLIDSGRLGSFWTGVHRCVLNLFCLTGALIYPAGHHDILRPLPSPQMSLKELILALTMSSSHLRFCITGIQPIPNPLTVPPTIRSSVLALASAGRH